MIYNNTALTGINSEQISEISNGNTHFLTSEIISTLKNYKWRWNDTHMTKIGGVNHLKRQGGHTKTSLIFESVKTYPLYKS